MESLTFECENTTPENSPKCNDIHAEAVSNSFRRYQGATICSVQHKTLNQRCPNCSSLVTCGSFESLTLLENIILFNSFRVQMDEIKSKCAEWKTSTETSALSNHHLPAGSEYLNVM